MCGHFYGNTSCRLLPGSQNDPGNFQSNSLWTFLCNNAYRSTLLAYPIFWSGLVSTLQSSLFVGVNAILNPARLERCNCAYVYTVLMLERLWGLEHLDSFLVAHSPRGSILWCARLRQYVIFCQYPKMPVISSLTLPLGRCESLIFSLTMQLPIGYSWRLALL